MAEFWADDGLFYKLALQIGAGSFVTSYAGTLVIVQRAVVMLEVSVPPALAPVVGNVAALLVTALVAGFLASPRMSRLIPSATWRIVLAIVFVLLPATGWLFWTLASVQWLTATYLVAMLVATLPASARGRFGDALGLLAAGLTGPQSILLLPLYVLRGVRAPAWRWHAIWLGIAAAVQAVVFPLSYREAAAGPDLAALPEVLALRAVVLPLAGTGATVLPTFVAATVLLIALAAAVWRLPRTLLAGAAYVAIGVAVAGIWATQLPTATLVDPRRDPQYFYLCGVILAGLIVAALARGRRAAIPIALVLLIGIVGDARIAPIPPVGWAERADCIGGPLPCVVPVAPDSHWWVRWP